MILKLNKDKVSIVELNKISIIVELNKVKVVVLVVVGALRTDSKVHFQQ